MDCATFMSGYSRQLSPVSVTGYVNLSKPSGFFTYHQAENSKILHGPRFAFSVLYGYQNRQWLFPYTSLTEWLL